MSAVTLIVTPLGQVALDEDPDAAAVAPAIAARLGAAFARGAGHGLLSLATWDIGAALPPVLGWWRDFAARLLAGVCTLPEGAALEVAASEAGELQALAWSVPPMTGAEYVSVEVLARLWAASAAALAIEVAEAGGGLGAYLAARNSAWHVVGRVHVNLAENRKDAEAPFAFIATYTTRLSAQGKAQHLPLGQALKEYAGAKDKARLLALLAPLQRAAEGCGWLAALIASREIFGPLRWTAADAVRLLQDVPTLERAGVVVRMPATWRASRPARATVQATVGGRAPTTVGVDALLEVDVRVMLEGEPLSEAELAALLASAQGLVFLRGRWVEVARDELARTIARFREIERVADEEGLGFHDAMRLLAGASAAGGASGASGASGEAVDPTAAWSEVVAGPWLAEALAGLRGPQGLAAIEPGAALRATLRPYQEVGLRWLHLLARLRLGALLADDMGLGKTIQILSLLLVLQRERGPGPSLLVVPASLLGNWQAEAARFAPSLRVVVAHGAGMSAAALKALGPAAVASCDLVITSYGALHRLAWLREVGWRLVVLDEAQAIKNPGARQSKAARTLKAEARIALTGTPIENRLGDLWSIFDVINPGLLGSAKAFTAWTKQLAGAPGGYAPLRRLVQPYLLRRLKTDRAVISDLPDKSEVTAFCGLSRTQAALYEQAVTELAAAIKTKDGIARRGLVLAFLMRLKQICNHPSQWLGDGAWAEADSGKLGRLRELTEVIAAKQEKVLVFSQFRETTAPLATFLAGVFGRDGLVLTGETPVKARQAMVRKFQEDERVPFFVLSLKAGGAGLNLTAAAHVIHFDRWWNPAVESQATDRAFRIGQTRNVLVHKFVCRGTVEEKIDAMLAAKRSLADELLSGEGEVNLTELTDEALLALVRLDLATASAEN
jgi:non-specific serine/threonine protein kinase